MIAAIKNWSNNFNRRIGSKILLLITVICALQMIVSVVIYGFSYNDRKSEVIDENIRILGQTNNNYLSIIVSEMEDSTRDIFYDEVFWNTGSSEELEGEIYSILANKLRTIDNADSIYLFCSVTDKMYIMDEASFLGIPTKTIQNNMFIPGYETFSEMDWFAEAKSKNGKMAVSRNLDVRNGAHSMISFSRYLKYPLNDSEDFYAVTININDSFFTRLEEQVCEDGELLYLLDETNACIYSGKTEADIDSLSSLASESEPWFKITLDNISYIGIKNTSEEYSWTMIKLIPEKKILQKITRSMVISCLVIFIIFLGGFLFLKESIRKITLPIEELAKNMRNYPQGTVFKDETMALRKDEIGILYQSYEKMNERIEELIESEYKSQILEKQARLEALQAQIDPHFLYNTLQTVSGIAIEKNVLEIEEINNSLSRILRYSLNNKKSLVMLREELENIKRYMDIQKYRYGDKIRLELALSEEIMECFVPVFTLQLAVENSIKHGIEPKVGAGVIKIYDDRKSDQVRRLYVEDNGIGIPVQKLADINAMLHGTGQHNIQNTNDCKGLFNLNQRLKHQFGQEYGIELKNNPGEGALLIIYIRR